MLDEVHTVNSEPVNTNASTVNVNVQHVYGDVFWPY